MSAQDHAMLKEVESQLTALVKQGRSEAKVIAQGITEKCIKAVETNIAHETFMARMRRSLEEMNNQFCYCDEQADH